MVKRTAVVLSILSVIVLAAGPSMAQLPANNWTSPLNDCFGGFGMARTVMIPADCPDMIPRTIHKTWECKIEGPCPAPAMGGMGMGGLAKSDDRLGWLTATCMALGTPLDFLFGGCDGVYGCVEFSDGGPCGSICGGPAATVLRSLTYAWFPTEGSFFGGLW